MRSLYKADESRVGFQIRHGIAIAEERILIDDGKDEALSPNYS